MEVGVYLENNLLWRTKSFRNVKRPFGLFVTVKNGLNPFKVEVKTSILELYFFFTVPLGMAVPGSLRSPDRFAPATIPVTAGKKTPNLERKKSQRNKW